MRDACGGIPTRVVQLVRSSTRHSSSGKRSSARQSLQAKARSDPPDKSVCTHTAVWFVHVSLYPKQPFLSNPPLVLFLQLLRVLDVMKKKKKKAGQQMHCVVWTQSALPWATANRKTSLLGHCYHTATDLAKMSHRSYRVFSYRTIFIPISRAFRGIFCAEPTGFCLQRIAATECAILPIRELAAYPWCSACERPSSRERVGPCRHRSLSTDSVGSQNKCLGMGAQAGQTAPAGRPDSIHDSEPDLWKWDLDVAGNFSPCVPERVPRHSGHGSLSQNLSSLTLHPILAAPFVEAPSPSPTASPSGEVAHAESVVITLSNTHSGALNKGPLLCRAKHQWTVHQSDNHPSPRSADTIRGHSVLAQSSAAQTLLECACVRFTSFQAAVCTTQRTVRVLGLIRGPKNKEDEEELSGHTGWSFKRQRTRSRLSLGMCPEWGWTCWSSIFIARHIFRRLPVRRPRAQSAAPAVKSTVQDGLASARDAKSECAISAFEGLVPWYRSAGRANWGLNMAGGYCLCVPEPPLPLRPTVPSQPRFLLQEPYGRCRVRLALSGVPREPKASSSSTSLPTTDSGAPGSESPSSCKTPDVCPPLWHSFRFMQHGSLARSQRFG